jgi:hypothetical protein
LVVMSKGLLKLFCCCPVSAFHKFDSVSILF